MNRSRITELRQGVGWTQERLAAESGVGLRTIQRLESGQDASLETLSLVADALRVQVRELFETIDDGAYSERVEALDARAEQQQGARDRISRAWWWLYVGIGIVATISSFGLGRYGVILFFAYWAGGSVILTAVQRIYLEPRLDQQYPLSRSRRERRSRRRSGPPQSPAAGGEL